MVDKAKLVLNYSIFNMSIFPVAPHIRGVWYVCLIILEMSWDWYLRYDKLVK